MNVVVLLRKYLRRWLGIAMIQRQVRDLEDGMAVSSTDLERLNAATSRIAARVASLLDQIDALGTGNDDEVRVQAQQEAILQASSDLRPVIDQLEALGADASQPVPEPSPEQVPVEPGPDVPPVENVPAEDETPVETPVEEAPVAETPAEEVPGTEVPAEAPVSEETVPGDSAPAEEGTVLPSDSAPEAGGDTSRQ